MRRTVGVVLGAVLVVSCAGRTDEGASAPGAGSTSSTDPPPTVAVTAAALCSDAIADGDGARVASAGLSETSGVVASRRHPGVLWAHNDSGSPAEVHAVGEDGSDRGRVAIDGAPAVDWEDIALGAGPDAGVDHLYVGDIGDNRGERQGERGIRLIRVPEPDPPRGGGGGPGVDGGGDGTDGSAAVRGVVFDLAYEDGPRDAETLLVDPHSGDVFVVSKQWDGSAAGVYRLPAAVVLAAEPPVGAHTMNRVADVAGTAGVWVTGGDISPDGHLIALRTYTEVRLWDREPGRDVAETLASPPTCRRRVIERQGEAIGFAADGRGFVTISEGEHPPVLWHRLPENL